MDAVPGGGARCTDSHIEGPRSGMSRGFFHGRSQGRLGQLDHCEHRGHSHLNRRDHSGHTCLVDLLTTKTGQRVARSLAAAKRLAISCRLHLIDDEMKSTLVVGWTARYAACRLDAGG